MGKQKKKGLHFSPKDTEILLRAMREGKSVRFDTHGRPIIKDDNRDYQPRYTAKSDTPQVGGETVSVKPGSLLSPVEDVLLMVESLELFASHCSDRLSDIERRREDCTHQLEPTRYQNDPCAESLSDETILAIGKKLQRIGIERRSIKNRFEIIKVIKRAFTSRPGRECLEFMNGLLAEVAGVVAEQRQRTYTPRTDELNDLFEQDETPDIEDPLVAMSAEKLTHLLQESEDPSPSTRRKKAVPA